MQSFISAARSVRDLWTGSAILSWITFRAMLPVIRAVGPTAVIFPSLRGTPLMDLWLRDEGGLANKLQPPSDLARKRPSLPNRFLALVPWGEGGANASKIAAACEEAAREAWRELADAVRRKLDGILSDVDADWARRWAMQIDSFFEMRTVCLPERECADDDLAKLLGRSQFGDTWPEAEKVRALARCLPAADRPGYDQENAGRWAAHVDMVARLLEARRSVRHVPDIPAPPQAGRSPPKCSLLGSYEQVGPDDLDASRRFWEQADKRALDGVRLRKGERFCAIALTKRFAVPALLAKELRLDPADLRFPDTATVAAADWLKRAGIEWTELRNQTGQAWNGQWLHWRGQHDDQDEDRVPDPTWQIIKDARDRLKDKPPAYYAILSMDADHMGRWLRGEKTPPIRDVYHPQLVRYFEGLGEHASGLLDARRPLGPALHAAISEALTNFAVRIVPGIVAKHLGTLIYAGGDDVLALLPTRTVLACAAELRAAFRGEESWNNGAAEGYYRADGRDLLVMGPKATLSAGIAVVHRKEDLRLALSAARDAEKAAKHAGRDCLQVAVWRRSGERSSAPCSWPALAWMERLVDAFGKGASDRWAYRLCAELPTLEGDVLPTEAIEAEIRRAVDRSEEPTRQLLNPADPAAAGKVMAETFAKYLHVRQKREAGRNGGRGRVLGDFLTLCRTASFLARGRDE